MAKSHVVIVSYPMQGHVIPLMEFARRLTNEGIKVTFVNTEAIHKVVTSNLEEKEGDLLHMASISDGLESPEDRKDFRKTLKAMVEIMPGKLEELVEKISEEDRSKVTCIVADSFMGWVIGVAKKMGIGSAAYCPSSATTQAILMCAQKWIDDGLMNSDETRLIIVGIPQNNDMIQLCETMPPTKPSILPWMSVPGVDPGLLFQFSKVAAEECTLADWILCNSSYELEPPIYNEFPQLLPVGPLLAGTQKDAKQTGQFWQEDSTCLTWLNQQPTSSIIYIAFGSIATFTQTQFEHLALGLETSNRPFMWVVRKNENCTFPDGYVERVGPRGKIVTWAPQQKVLAHSSVACFISHCGWNSSLEGVTNGLPFLCWPFISDQFLDAAVICDTWKTGLGFDKDEEGVVTKDEIRRKIDELLGDKVFKDMALELKEKVTCSIRPGGSSYRNLCGFIDWVQGKESR
ncbi:hypothetical protein LXL04_000650 [Taraxacum kok-saghyz]